MSKETKGLSERVARHFSPKPWKHNVRTKWAGDPPMEDPPTICTRCGLLDPELVGCRIPDPVDITKLGPALECYRKLLNPRYLNCELNDFMRIAYNKSTGNCLIGPAHPEVREWFSDEATAEQIWEINCLAKENSNE